MTARIADTPATTATIKIILIATFTVLPNGEIFVTS
jgi:hypothetical protein